MHAEEGKQEIRITREFDLPLPLLFKAYADPELVEQWMGTKVLKLENKQHGGYEFETSDVNGSVVFRTHGAIHEFEPNARITRTWTFVEGSFLIITSGKVTGSAIRPVGQSGHVSPPVGSKVLVGSFPIAT